VPPPVCRLRSGVGAVRGVRGGPAAAAVRVPLSPPRGCFGASGRTRTCPISPAPRRGAPPSPGGAGAPSRVRLVPVRGASGPPRALGPSLPPRVGGRTGTRTSHHPGVGPGGPQVVPGAGSPEGVERCGGSVGAAAEALRTWGGGGGGGWGVLNLCVPRTSCCPLSWDDAPQSPTQSHHGTAAVERFRHAQGHLPSAVSHERPLRSA
jgi:hypothetical protein